MGRVEAVMEVVVRARVAVAIERVVAVTVEVAKGRVGVAKGVVGPSLPFYAPGGLWRRPSRARPPMPIRQRGG